MPRRTKFAVRLPLLFVAVVVPGCKSAGPPQAPPFETAGLRIEVTDVANIRKRQKIEVRTRIWNDQDRQATFDLGNVRLLYGTREVSAKWVMSDFNPDILPKGNKKFRWAFELGEEAQAGTYTVEIRALRFGGEGDTTATFTINVGE
jgi:hypothetical protein